jgi:zinc-ribbon domain
MYCPDCGTKVVKGQKFCVNCGAKLTQSKTSGKAPKSLFQKIALTSLNLMSSEGDKWKRNTELMPDDCWILFMNTSKAQATSYLDKHNLPQDPSIVDMVEKSFFNSHSYGLWIWVAEKQNTDPTIFNGRIHFDYNQIAKDPMKFITDWDALLDHIDKLIPPDIEPSLSVAEVKMVDAIDNSPVLKNHLSAGQLHGLKSDLKGAIYRGYLLHKFFK